MLNCNNASCPCPPQTGPSLFLDVKAFKVKNNIIVTQAFPHAPQKETSPANNKCLPPAISTFSIFIK